MMGMIRITRMIKLTTTGCVTNLAVYIARVGTLHWTTRKTHYLEQMTRVYVFITLLPRTDLLVGSIHTMFSRAVVFQKKIIISIAFKNKININVHNFFFA